MEHLYRHIYRYSINKLLFLYTVLPTQALVEVANMKMEKLKKISVAMILGGAFGGFAGTLEGAALLGMVIGAAAGAAEVICLESGTSLLCV